ncbi:MAG: acyl-CoA/acyl-ACP dehydrogenase, partial [Desulfobacula sp.]|nr:acyl-CoA/acyl-ACP dehydrogenase [Desulfobacula sp.]
RKFPDKIWKKAADLGFIGIQFDEKYSGGDLGIFEAALIAQEFCRIDSTMGMVLTLCSLGSEAVYHFGDKNLKEKFLPKICEGDMRCAIAFSESNHGLDISSINTSAAVKGNGLVLNGQKTHVTDIGTKGFYLVLCKTDLTNDSPEKSLSMILVEADKKNIFIKDSGDKFSLNMMKSAEVVFQGVKVPMSNIVGNQGKGLHQLENFLNEMRIITAAQALGIAQGALDRAVGYIKQRQQFNRKIARFQIIQHKIADMATKVELARVITYKAAFLFDRGTIDTSLISMAKMTATRTAVEIADEAIQIFGGYGYMKETEVERFFRDAKTGELRFGNRAAQQDIIGKAVTGKIK